MYQTQNCKCISHYLDRKPKLKMETQTTNKAFHKPMPLEKPQTFDPPKVNQKHYDPQVLQSSYKAQYVKPTLNHQDNTTYDRSQIIQKYNNNKPKVPFYSETSYKSTFQPHKIQPEKPPTYQYKPKNTKFQGQSSYKSQFIPKKNTDLIAQQILKPQQYLARKPKIQFQGTSAYKQQFKQIQIKPERQPEYKYQKKPTKFQGSSSYKQTFKAPTKEAYKSELEYCPVHPAKVAIK